MVNRYSNEQASQNEGKKSNKKFAAAMAIIAVIGGSALYYYKDIDKLFLSSSHKATVENSMVLVSFGKTANDLPKVKTVSIPAGSQKVNAKYYPEMWVVEAVPTNACGLPIQLATPSADTAVKNAIIPTTEPNTANYNKNTKRTINTGKKRTNENAGKPSEVENPGKLESLTIIVRKFKPAELPAVQEVQDKKDTLKSVRFIQNTVKENADSARFKQQNKAVPKQPQKTPQFRVYRR